MILAYINDFAEVPSLNVKQFNVKQMQNFCFQLPVT